MVCHDVIANIDIVGILGPRWPCNTLNRLRYVLPKFLKLAVFTRGRDLRSERPLVDEHAEGRMSLSGLTIASCGT